MEKHITFGMEWKVYGIQTAKLPDYIDENNKEEVQAYLDEIWDSIPLPINFEYLCDSDVMDLENMEINYTDDNSIENMLVGITDSCMNLYNSHGVWDSLYNIIELEKERENYPFVNLDFKEDDIKEYKAIWVTKNPEIASSYLCCAGDYKNKKLIKENVKNVVAMKPCCDDFIFKYSDDGDEGFLLVTKDPLI